jgi:hypothetical protein
MDLLNIARSGLRVGETVAVAAASSIASSQSVATVPAVTPAATVQTLGPYPQRPFRAAARAKPGGGAVPADEEEGEVESAGEAVDPVVAQNLYTASAAILRTERRMRGSFDRLA